MRIRFSKNCRSLVILAIGIASLASCKSKDSKAVSEEAPTRDPRINWENFERIKLGMTPEEVEQVLGLRGKEIPVSGTPDLAGDIHRLYGSPDVLHTIIVGFKNGRVVGKTAILTDDSGRHWSKDG